MKKLKTFIQFINEAAPAPAQQPQDEEEATTQPTAPASAAPTSSGSEAGTEVGTAPESSAADAGTQADSSLTTDPNSTPGSTTTAAPGTAPVDPTASPTDAGTSNGATGGSSNLGSAPSLGGSSSAGSTSGAGISPSPTGTPDSSSSDQAATQPAETEEKKPEDYTPPVNTFNIVLMDKNKPWSQQYPDGGGVKDMKGYELSWKDLNKWIDDNKLGEKKQDIAEYLLGESDKLDDDVKEKLKQAIEDKKVGDTNGETEVEFDDDMTPYVQDINTILVNL